MNINFDEYIHCPSNNCFLDHPTVWWVETSSESEMLIQIVWTSSDYENGWIFCDHDDLFRLSVGATSPTRPNPSLCLLHLIFGVTLPMMLQPRHKHTKTPSFASCPWMYWIFWFYWCSCWSSCGRTRSFGVTLSSASMCQHQSTILSLSVDVSLDVLSLLTPLVHILVFLSSDSMPSAWWIWLKVMICRSLGECSICPSEISTQFLC